MDCINLIEINALTLTALIVIHCHIQLCLFWMDVDVKLKGPVSQTEIEIAPRPGVFNVFQAKDPQTDGDTAGTPYFYILYKIVFYIKLVL